MSGIEDDGGMCYIRVIEIHIKSSLKPIVNGTTYEHSEQEETLSKQTNTKAYPTPREEKKNPNPP